MGENFSDAKPRVCAFYNDDTELVRGCASPSRIRVLPNLYCLIRKLRLSDFTSNPENALQLTGAHGGGIEVVGVRLAVVFS
jgi:hypothetical protein